jgi:hypothetical protein
MGPCFLRWNGAKGTFFFICWSATNSATSNTHWPAEISWSLAPGTVNGLWRRSTAIFAFFELSLPVSASPWSRSLMHPANGRCNLKTPRRLGNFAGSKIPDFKIHIIYIYTYVYVYMCIYIYSYTYIDVFIYYDILMYWHHVKWNIKPSYDAH